MRHRKAGVKLNRTTSHRQAMFRNMVTSLLKHERIRTTDVKAKELRRWADKIITLAKRGDLHARRQALAIVREKDVVHKLFEEADQRFGKINGGYTRVIKVGHRPGDAAPVSIIELVSIDEGTRKKKKKAKVTEKKAAPVETAATEKETAEPDAVVASPEVSEDTTDTDTSEIEVAEQEAEPEEKASDEATAAAAPEEPSPALDSSDTEESPSEKSEETDKKED